MSIDTTIKTQGNQLTFSTIALGDGLEQSARDAPRRHHRHDPGLQAQRPGRGGLPHRHQVELRRGREADAQVHHVQRRRGRAGHLQGPADPERIRRIGHGGHDHRRPGDRRLSGAHLSSGRVRLPAQAPRRRGQGAQGSGPARAGHRRHQGLQLQHHGRDGRGRLRLRRRDGAHRVSRRVPGRAAATVPRSRSCRAS